MWTSKLFSSLLVLLDFVNERRLTHDRFKVVVVPARVWQRRSSIRYYLLYRPEERERLLVATRVAESRIDQEAAIDTAEEIIASAQGRGQTPGRPDA